MATLKFIDPPAEASPREFTTEALRIGRSPKNDLVVRDPHVSRFHAKIVRGAFGYYLVGLDSRNRTLVNGHPAEEPMVLDNGDRIQLGSTILAFESTTVPNVRIEETPRQAFSPVSSRSQAKARGHRMLGAILDADRELRPGRPLAEALGVILEMARQAIPFERGAVLLRRWGDLIPIAIYPSSATRDDPIIISRGILTHVMRTGTGTLTSDAMADDRFTGYDSVHRNRVRSALCVPIMSPGGPLGAVYLDSSHEARLFSRDDLEILERIADLAGCKIECTRMFRHALEADRMQRELDVAWDLQRSILPAEPPRVPGYEFHAITRPCLQVGGDAYDYVTFPDGRVGLCVVDSAGHGLDASLLMAYCQASLRALCDLDLTAADTCRRLNGLLNARIPSNRFVTLFFGILDAERHTLSWVNAGQPSPVIVGRAGDTTFLKRTGMPIGMFPDSAFRARTNAFDPGAVLVCFSDGLIDARDGAGRPFGAERLIELAVALRGLPPGEFVGEVMARVDAHAGAEPVDADDLTIMMVRRDAA